MKHVLGAVVSLAVLGVGFTWWALESSGVARITTHAPDGALRTTHVWFVERDGVLWIEAGTPESPWYVDIGQRPDLTLERAGAPTAGYRAESAPERSAWVRSALRRKYGLRDRWVGAFVDASRSLAVRLVPLGPRSP